MKGCFENIDAAVDYIKYMSFDEPNVKVKLYREAGCWYVQGYGGTVCNEPPVGWYCTRLVGHEGPCAAHPLLGGLQSSEIIK